MNIIYDGISNTDDNIYEVDLDELSKSSHGIFEVISEATYKDILGTAEDKRLKKSKKIVTEYKGVTDSRGWIKFETRSSTDKNKKYVQYIKLKEAKDMKYFNEFNDRDIIRLFMSGSLEVYCSCPDFKYRQKYAAKNGGFGIYKEDRFPNKRNPELKNLTCKHLLSVLSVLPNNWTRIAKDMKDTKFYKKIMGENK